jgi:hypothetical protein
MKFLKLKMQLTFRKQTLYKLEFGLQKIISYTFNLDTKVDKMISAKLIFCVIVGVFCLASANNQFPDNRTLKRATTVPCPLPAEKLAKLKAFLTECHEKGIRIPEKIATLGKKLLKF